MRCPNLFLTNLSNRGFSPQITLSATHKKDALLGRLFYGWRREWEVSNSQPYQALRRLTDQMELPL
jgi:hypothetical protein